MQETGFDWLLFAFVVVIPKGFRGALYASTAPQNRFSEGYSAKDKRLPLYWVLTPVSYTHLTLPTILRV